MHVSEKVDYVIIHSEAADIKTLKKWIIKK